MSLKLHTPRDPTEPIKECLPLDVQSKIVPDRSLRVNLLELHGLVVPAICTRYAEKKLKPGAEAADRALIDFGDECVLCSAY
jgi:phosphoserine phosphatase